MFVVVFSRSFTANKYCRICTATSKQCKIMTEEVASQVRTRESYDVDFKLRDPKSTGIYEECVFNKLSDFHITENQAVDVMHDILRV